MGAASSSLPQSVSVCPKIIFKYITDEFLSLINPLYFIEVLADKGRGMLERNLPPIHKTQVLQELNAETKKVLDLSLIHI